MDLKEMNNKHLEKMVTVVYGEHTGRTGVCVESGRDSLGTEYLKIEFQDVCESNWFKLTEVMEI